MQRLCASAGCAVATGHSIAGSNSCTHSASTVSQRPKVLRRTMNGDCMIDPVFETDPYIFIPGMSAIGFGVALIC